MKRKWLMAIFLVVSVCVLCGGYRYDRRPLFVSKAEADTASFLKYTYGPGKCRAKSAADQQWEMECVFEEGEKIFKYAITSPDYAQYKKTRQFHLVALNERASQTAHEGLTKLLLIETANDPVRKS